MGKTKKTAGKVRAYVFVSSRKSGLEKRLRSVKEVSNVEKLEERHHIAVIHAESRSHALEIIESKIAPVEGVLSAVPVLFAKG